MMITDGEGSICLPSPSGLFSDALKPFELLTYKFVNFPNYEFNTSNQRFSSIDNYFVYFNSTFCRHDHFRSLRIMSDREHNPINDKIYFGRFRYQ